MSKMRHGDVCIELSELCPSCGRDGGCKEAADDVTAENSMQKAVLIEIRLCEEMK